MWIDAKNEPPNVGQRIVIYANIEYNDGPYVKKVDESFLRAILYHISFSKIYWFEVPELPKGVKNAD